MTAPDLNTVVAALNGSDPNASTLITDYLAAFDPGSVRKEQATFLRLVIDSACKLLAPQFCVEVLSAAIGRYPAGSLTPLHAPLAKMCCMTRAYEYAVNELVPRPTDYMSTAAHHLVPQDHLEYHFYLAICLASCGDRQTSLFYFSLVLICGGEASSLIQVEAYQMYVLVGLLEHGRATPPEGMSQTLTRSLQVLAKPYDELAEAFARVLDAVFPKPPAAQDHLSANSIFNFTSPDTADLTTPIPTTLGPDEEPFAALQRVAATHMARFSENRAQRLVTEAIASVPMHCAIRIARVYTSISIGDLANGCHLGTPDDVRKMLHQASARGRLQGASITDDGWVLFPRSAAATTDSQSRAPAAAARFDPNNQAALIDMQRRMAQMTRQLDIDAATATAAGANTAGTATNAQQATPV
ncbi:hypothetical protein PYCC9005_005073 [Savitreella phatthalungensis]